MMKKNKNNYNYGLPITFYETIDLLRGADVLIIETDCISLLDTYNDMHELSSHDESTSSRLNREFNPQ